MIECALSSLFGRTHRLTPGKDGMAVARRWESRDVSIVMPKAEMWRMFQRALTFDVTGGGRFDARSNIVLLWSSSAVQAEGGDPIGAFSIAWGIPTDQQATIERIEWDQEAGGSEAEVLRAIDVLKGQG